METEKEPKLTDAQLTGEDIEHIKYMATELSHLNYLKWKKACTQIALNNMLKNHSMLEIEELNLGELLKYRKNAISWLNSQIKTLGGKNEWTI